MFKLFSFVKFFTNFNFICSNFWTFGDYNYTEDFAITSFCKEIWEVFQSKDFERWFNAIFKKEPLILELFWKYKESKLSNEESAQLIWFLQLNKYREDIGYIIERVSPKFEAKLDKLWIDETKTWITLLEIIFNKETWPNFIIENFIESVKKSVKETTTQTV